MNLRDEINSVLKTPMQVNEDQRQASINSGRGNAEKDYKYLKLCIVGKDKEELKMGGTLLVIGIIWFLVECCKDTGTKQVPDGTDFHAAYLDAGKLSKKEYTRRLDSGYYVKKDK